MHKTKEIGKNTDSLSAQQLAPLMGVTRQTIRNWINNGDIRAHHAGRSFRIPVSEALRILHHYDLPVPDWLTDTGHALQ